MPAAVPSLRQSSTPCAGSSLAKNSVPLSAANWPVAPKSTGPAFPGLMSASMVVPAAVPSLTQSSVPAARARTARS